MTTYAPTAIDLSRIPAPAAIEALDYETLLSAVVTRFKAFWADARQTDPSLPDYDVDMLETDPAMIVGQVFAYLRLLDRQRVNDGIKALLAPFAQGTDLDNIVARQGIARLTVIPATANEPAVMETDIALLRRYLLSFDRPSAGSAARYLYEAWTAWPGMRDARVNGFKVHGRRGDTDIVIIGPDGDLATPEQRGLVSDAVRADHVKPEAVSVSVLDATRVEYAISLTIEVAPGPDPEIVRQEAIARITSAALARMLIGGEIPPGLLKGAAYGASVISVTDHAPVTIAADPYSVPVMTSLNVAVEVRS